MHDEAFAEFYDQHSTAAYSLAMHILRDPERAADAVQEAFLSAWRRADTFNPTRGETRGWLLAIVRHRSIDMLRHDRPRLGEASIDDVEVIGPSNPEAEALAGIEAQHVRVALAFVPEHQRQVLELAYFGGLSQVEIAEMTGTPLGTIKSRARFGLDRLRSMLVGVGIAA